MKARRQAEILAIIQEYDIETQDQLLEKLREKGMKSTQATISRDIKELHLVKELTGRSTYKYAVSERKTSLNVAGRLNNIFRESVTSFDSAQNIVCDSDNDLQMTDVAGISVCMANGSENLKKRCDRIAPSVYEDGIAKEFKALGLI